MLIWMIVIFCFSSASADISGGQSMSLTEKLLDIIGINLTTDGINALENVIRKIAHFTEYFVLGVLAMLYVSSVTSCKKAWLFAFVLCVIYACSDEIHQHFVPGRACRLFDICIDSCGSFLAIYLTKLIRIKLNLSSNKIMRNNY